MEGFGIEVKQLALVLALMIGEYVLVLVSILADLWSGLRKARQRGEACRSKALRLTVDKMGAYYNALLALTVIDVMQIAAVEYLRVCCGLGVPLFPLFTLLGAVGIAVIEVKSIFEKASAKQQAEAEQAARTLLKCISTLRDKDIVAQVTAILEGASGGKA